MTTLRYWMLITLRYAESVDLYLAKQRQDLTAAANHRIAISRIDQKLALMELNHEC